MPRLVSDASAATTARPSTGTPFSWPFSIFQASSASRPVVAASPFMMQAPVNTSAVLASTYVPVTDAGLAPSDTNIRLDSATESAIFFIASFSRLSWCPVPGSLSLLQLAAVPPVAAAVRADGLAVGAERGLRHHTPVRRRVVWIVQRRFARIYRRIDVHLLRAQLEAVDAGGDFHWFHRITSCDRQPGGVQDRALDGGLRDLDFVGVLAHRLRAGERGLGGCGGGFRSNRLARERLLGSLRAIGHRRDRAHDDAREIGRA